MSIASSLSALAAAKNDIAEAITAKGGTVGTGAGFTSFADAIATIPSGGAPASVSPKDINFYDYDGRIVAAWTLSELADKEELPPNPSHEGLTAQGWNWTLADLKAENAPMNVGQMYITDDGKTRLYIRISQYGRMTVPLHWYQSADSGVTIDWGDNSTPETYTGTGDKNTTHTYASVGDYVITLEVTSGTMRLGNGFSGNCVLGSTSTAGRVYTSMLKKVEIGNGVLDIGNYAFYTCSSLTSITIPNSVTNIGTNTFQNGYSLTSITIPSSVTNIGNPAFYTCYSLASITIPKSVESISANTFQNGYSLTSITIPSGVQSIGNNAFYACRSLASITIPSSVTNIGDSAFAACRGVAHYYVYPTIPPVLGSTSVFDGIPSDCKIYVPDESVESYKTATNWTTYASYIYPMSERES